MFVVTVMPSAMGIPAQGMSAVPMQRAPQYKINPAMRNPQQPVAAGQPMPPPVRIFLVEISEYCNVRESKFFPHRISK